MDKSRHQELINEKNQAYKSCCQSKNNTFSVHQFKLHQSKSNSQIEKSKFNYYAGLSKKLSDPMTSLKSCESILKTLLNNKKIPCIPPLLQDDKFITNFKEKVEIFKFFLQNNVIL